MFVDGICLKRSWGGEVRNVSVLVAIAVGADGYREVLGVEIGGERGPTPRAEIGMKKGPTVTASLCWCRRLRHPAGRQGCLRWKITPRFAGPIATG